jgi:hypothetical protein
VRGQGVSDLVDGETELLELSGQENPVEVALVEGAVATSRARRALQDPAALVEPHRIDGNAGGLSELAYAHALVSHCEALPSRLDSGPCSRVYGSGMTKLLSITAQPGAHIACDMTEAEDTLAQRLLEYRRLFQHALLDRQSTPTATTFRLAAYPGITEWVLDLVRREAICCPFLSYEVDQVGEEIVWTTSGGLGAAEIAVLDDLAAPDPGR